MDCRLSVDYFRFKKVVEGDSKATREEVQVADDYLDQI